MRRPNLKIQTSSRLSFSNLSDQVTPLPLTIITPCNKQNKISKVKEQGTIWKKFLLSDLEQQPSQQETPLNIQIPQTERKSLQDVTNYFSVRNTQRDSVPLVDSYKNKVTVKERNSIPCFPTISEFQCEEQQGHHESCQSLSYGEVIENYRVKRDQRMRRREERRTRTRVSTEFSERSLRGIKGQSALTQKSKYTDEEVELMREELFYLRKHFFELSQQKDRQEKEKQLLYQTPYKK